jgi:2Fe-2S ferredoxin
MVKLCLISHDGVHHELEVAEGTTVMQAALNNMVPGILGDCGGACSCATCHAYVDPAWQDKLGAPGEDEEMMLDGVLEQRPTSRLTCQLVVDASLEGMVLHLPQRQC